MLSQGMTS
uniref:Uncharacterized protein n=1 Tax=Anguilla anguilla TaxID=7936 RepID=A0A0E9XQ67_ANGAN